MARGGTRPGAGRKSELARLQAKVTAGSPLAKRAAELLGEMGDIGEIIANSQGDLGVAQAEAQEMMVKALIRSQQTILASLMALAEGVRVQEDGEDGPVVYQKPPDRQAAQFLLEMLHGRATQKQQVQQDTTIQLVSVVPRPSVEALQQQEAELASGDPVEELELEPRYLPAPPASDDTIRIDPV